MYSGITGEEFRADIYIGVVYYQRLRHMVSDKYQVRGTGPVHNLTMQPVQVCAVFVDRTVGYRILGRRFMLISFLLHKFRVENELAVFDLAKWNAILY